MKKACAVLFSVLLVVFICGCANSKNSVLNSIGDFSEEQFFSWGISQDFTDYAKYKYEKVDFTNNSYFSNVTDTAAENLKGYIEDFEKSVQSLKSSEPEQELAANYDFNTDCITADDYLYIYDDPDYPNMGNYTVYFFDTESMVLYYFHNNI